MNRPQTVAVAVAAIVCVASVVLAQSDKPVGGPPPPPPVRPIPGLTAPDQHPNACVDCHVNMKQFNMDVRISTLMEKWREGVEPKLLSAARASATDSTKITGRHPKLMGTRKDIPGSCLSCHGRSSTTAPPFARMIHLVHLVGGDSNLYMGYHQGDCTHCHKLDPKTGKWSIPSAVEPASE